jgi:hypothetical protein
LKLGENPRLLARAEALWGAAVRLSETSYWRKTMARQAFEDHFAPYSHDSAAVQALMGDSPWVVLLAVSLGDVLQQRVRDYMAKHRPMEGYLLDRMGSFLAETAMRRLTREVDCESRAACRKATRRFSPGYHDFSIKAQAPFVALIGHEWPNVHITSSGLLLPEKTITALVGVLPTQSVLPAAMQCTH